MMWMITTSSYPKTQMKTSVHDPCGEVSMGGTTVIYQLIGSNDLERLRWTNGGQIGHLP